MDNEQIKVDKFNENFPIGTPVVYWSGVKRGEGRESKTREGAFLLGGHTAVVMLEGVPGCVALDNVQVAKHA